MSLYFSRVMLNRYAPTRALSALLDPRDESERADAHHRLIWTLFGDAKDRPRDFLWRADGKGRFYTLSKRPPLANDLFCPPETKQFDPQLASGDKLAFVLRANATRDRRKGRGNVQRVDVVMDLLHGVTAEERAGKRQPLAQQAALEWMQQQGAARGFEITDLEVEDYRVLSLGRRRGRGMSHGVLDLNGQLQVTDPEALLTALTTGLGRAKAWGCGLMLIRRAR